MQESKGDMMDLNIPDTRQKLLIQRLESGTQIVAADVAQEFDVSVDTVRRDLIALERSGQAHRVRGGAIPISRPVAALHERLKTGIRPPSAIIDAALDVLTDYKTIILDGGSTVLALAQALRPSKGLLVITPSPWVAIACMEKDIETLMLGGRMLASAGIAVGVDCEQQLSGIAAEIAVLGACGIDPEFGVSSDDLHESGTKRLIARAATQTVVLANAAKIGTRARHRTLLPSSITSIITDAAISDCEAYEQQGINLICT